MCFHICYFYTKYRCIFDMIYETDFQIYRINGFINKFYLVKPSYIFLNASFV